MMNRFYDGWRIMFMMHDGKFYDDKVDDASMLWSNKDKDYDGWW